MARTFGASRVTRLPGDPSVGRKALFALGARLPDRNREWVRHDLTDAGWRGRLTVRHLLVMLPFAAALAAFPGALWIHLAVPGLFLLCSVGSSRCTPTTSGWPGCAGTGSSRPTIPTSGVLRIE